MRIPSRRYRTMHVCGILLGRLWLSMPTYNYIAVFVIIDALSNQI